MSATATILGEGKNETTGTSETLGLSFRVRRETGSGARAESEKPIPPSVRPGNLPLKEEREELRDGDNSRAPSGSCFVRAAMRCAQKPLLFCLVPARGGIDAGDMKTLGPPTLILRLRHVIQPVFVRFLTSFLCRPPEMMLFGSDVGAIGNLEPAEATAMGAEDPPTY